MRPSEAIAGRLDAVRAVIARHPVSNPRVFGSVARGEDDEKSDLDLLVDPTERTSLFDLPGLQSELTDLLGVPVDVFTPPARSGRGSPSRFTATRAHSDGAPRLRAIG